MEGLNRRNTESVEQALKSMYKKIDEQQTHIDGLNAAMSIIYERMNIFEKLIMLQKAGLIGTGPTVKE